MARLLRPDKGYPLAVRARPRAGVGRGLLSEAFQHDRLYGTVRAVNPFL